LCKEATPSQNSKFKVKYLIYQYNIVSLTDIYNEIEIKLQTYIIKLKHNEVKRENLRNYIIDFPIMPKPILARAQVPQRVISKIGIYKCVVQLGLILLRMTVDIVIGK
jgi:hypothetical protein